MPQFYPQTATRWLASLVQTELALSKLRLWQVGLITPSIATIRADLLAAEATYTGYTAGGVALTAWFAPLNNPIGGSSIDSPKVQFAPASPYTIVNSIGGFWIETATPDVVLVGTFAQPQQMGALGNGFDMSAALIFPNS